MKRLIRILVGVIVLLALGWGYVFFEISQTARVDLAAKADAIAVLSAAQYGGQPSPVYKARLDHAAELFAKGLAPSIITTGGIYQDESFSEGAVGKKYLLSIGISESNILTEEFSLSTKQNLMRIRSIAQEQGMKKIILVSDPFHMYRILLISRELEFTAFPSPTQTSPISQKGWIDFFYRVRETLLVILHILFEA